MAGVVASLIAGDDVEGFGEKVDHLPFSFVAPLRTKHDYVIHGDQNNSL
jgi:hypothetical protein